MMKRAQQFPVICGLNLSQYTLDQVIQMGKPYL